MCILNKHNDYQCSVLKTGYFFYFETAEMKHCDVMYKTI